MLILFGILLVLHGAITLAISAGTFAPAADIPNPEWLRWWPTQLGQSWAFRQIGPLGGSIWLISGILLVGSGLGVLGFLIPTAWWIPLAVAGSIVGLIAVLLYFHPYYVIALIVNGAIAWVALAIAFNPDSWVTGLLGVQ